MLKRPLRLRLLGPIAVAIVSGLAGVIAAKLQMRWAAMCASVPCSYVQIRLGVVKETIATHGQAQTYLVIGDSLTEIGRWRAMCGREPIAAGISGARTVTWLPHAKSIADYLKPEFVILALGTNDVLMLGRLGPYEQLVSSLSGYRLLAVPLHGMPSAAPEVVRAANIRIKNAVPQTAEAIDAVTTDGVHLTAEDYVRWFSSIETLVCRSVATGNQG